ncbi:MAG: hypothetical protein M1562_00740 [Candidatus Marsarchaeota archaeon]|nr:hypothetical protein [Candidatus Marsarchaeota archaeon]
MCIGNPPYPYIYTFLYKEIINGDYTVKNSSNKKNAKLARDTPANSDYPQIKIQNIVVSADLHASIDLYTLSRDVKSVDYEPEQFPGAIYRNADPDAVFIIFKNGKMICTKTKTEADIKRALESVAEVMAKYVVETPPAEEPKRSKRSNPS